MLLLLIIVAIALLALAAWLLEWRPIDSWRNFHKRWSTWLHLSGIANLVTYLPIDPRSGLSLWNQLPFAVQRAIPHEVLLWVGLALWVAAAIAVYVKQGKLNAS